MLTDATDCLSPRRPGIRDALARPDAGTRATAVARGEKEQWLATRSERAGALTSRRPEDDRGNG